MDDKFTFTLKSPITDEQWDKIMDVDFEHTDRIWFETKHGKVEFVKASAQQEITDEQAIDHLQATGWMQEHDRQMYEMGMKEQLKDDSGSYDNLIPQNCIYRQDAIDAVHNLYAIFGSEGEWVDRKDVFKAINNLPFVQPDLDAIWEKLSKVYNMPDVPDEALSIIGDVMLALEGEKNG